VRRLGPVAATLAAVALVSACGSTVQVQGQASLGSADGGLGTTGATALDGSTGATAVVPGGTTGAATSQTRGTTTTSVGGPQSPTSLPTVSVPDGSPKAPVEIGVVIFPDVNQAAKALGGTADVGDQKAESDTAITWVNDHGGLAGHKVVPVYFEVSLTSTQPYSVTYQQICTTFTQDHKVIAVVAIANVEKALPECLQKTRTLFFTHGHYLRSEQDYAQLANTITPEDPGSDRIARSLVKELLGSGAVKSGGKLGLLYMDYSAPIHAKDAIIEPAMKAAGISVVSYKIPYPQSTQDIANAASVVQSAELQMAAQGVKVVTFMCPGCVTFFTQYAESQGYYPRYVLTSLDGLLAYKGKGHTQSFANAIALGWDPIRDIGVYTSPGPLAANPTFSLCRQIEKANITQDASLYASIAICGAFQGLYTAAKANPSTVTGEGLMAGFHRLGSSFAGPSNLATLLKPGHRDGTTGYRTMKYVAACDCFQYDNVSLRTLS
jgi:hypothetical protein